jgi:hypothetical protein
MCHWTARKKTQVVQTIFYFVLLRIYSRENNFEIVGRGFSFFKCKSFYFSLLIQPGAANNLGKANNLGNC